MELPRFTIFRSPEQAPKGVESAELVSLSEIEITGQNFYNKMVYQVKKEKGVESYDDLTEEDTEWIWDEMKKSMGGIISKGWRKEVFTVDKLSKSTQERLKSFIKKRREKIIQIKSKIERGDLDGEIDAVPVEDVKKTVEKVEGEAREVAKRSKRELAKIAKSKESAQELLDECFSMRGDILTFMVKEGTKMHDRLRLDHFYEILGDEIWVKSKETGEYIRALYDEGKNRYYLVDEYGKKLRDEANKKMRAFIKYGDLVSLIPPLEYRKEFEEDVGIGKVKGSAGGKVDVAEGKVSGGFEVEYQGEVHEKFGKYFTLDADANVRMTDQGLEKAEGQATLSGDLQEELGDYFIVEADGRVKVSPDGFEEVEGETKLIGKVSEQLGENFVVDAEGYVVASLEGGVEAEGQVSGKYRYTNMDGFVLDLEGQVVVDKDGEDLTNLRWKLTQAGLDGDFEINSDGELMYKHDTNDIRATLNAKAHLVQELGTIGFVTIDAEGKVIVDTEKPFESGMESSMKAAVEILAEGFELKGEADGRIGIDKFAQLDPEVQFALEYSFKREFSGYVLDSKGFVNIDPARMEEADIMSKTAFREKVESETEEYFGLNLTFLRNKVRENTPKQCQLGLEYELKKKFGDVVSVDSRGGVKFNVDEEQIEGFVEAELKAELGAGFTVGLDGYLKIEEGELSASATLAGKFERNFGRGIRVNAEGYVSTDFQGTYTSGLTGGVEVPSGDGMIDLDAGMFYEVDELGNPIPGTEVSVGYKIDIDKSAAVEMGAIGKYLNGKKDEISAQGFFKVIY